MKNLANNYKLFWGLIGKNKKKVFILLGCIQVIAILEIVGISLFMPFLNGTLETSENSFDTRKYISFLLDLFSPKYQTLAIGFIIITIFLLKNILKIWYARYSVQFSLSYYVDWSTLTLQKYMFAPMSIVSNSKEGVLINDVTREPTNATKCIETIILMVSSLFVLFYLYIFLIMINTIVTLVISVFGIIIYYLFKVLIFTKTENFGKFKLKQNQKISAIAAESITAIKQIKLFSGEQLVQDNFFSKISYLSKKIIKHRIFIALPELFRELPLILFCVGAIVFISLIDESNFSEILPILAVVFIIGVRLFSLITQIIKNRMLVISLIPSLKLVNKNVTENTQKEELFKGKKIKNIERDIEIQDVAFKYNDSNQILNNLNLVIPRNKISAIVGPSGVGKTSIADLLMGLYFSNKGKIIINDTDIRGLQLASWRQLIGYVSQDTFIYNASIKENILIGNPYATNEEVIEASKMANAHEFIKNMKNNYNTIVGDRGIKMSGGQRQRIAIARAVVRKPKLFIFDEATSSLDNKSEALVQRSINKIGGKNTVLIITHRLSNVKKADVIFFLNEGEIKENGTFEELINKKGAFFSMYNESI